MGLSGTFVGRNLIASAGLISTGIMATAFQALVLCSAAVIYHLHLAPAAVVQVSLASCVVDYVDNLSFLSIILNADFASCCKPY